MQEVVQAVIRSQVDGLLGGLSPDAFNKAYAQVFFCVCAMQTELPKRKPSSVPLLSHI